MGLQSLFIHYGSRPKVNGPPGRRPGRNGVLSAWNAWNDRANAVVVTYYTRNVFTYKELRLQPQGTHKPWTQVEEGCAGDESRQDCVSPIKGGSVVGYRKKTLPLVLRFFAQLANRPQ